MNLKRIIALLSAAVLVLALMAGCGGTAPEEVDLIQSGKLIVGSEIGYPPFEFFADDGTTPMGMDIDLATEIAAILGLEVEFQNTDFEGILDGLGTNRYDIVMSSVTITNARLEKVDFSDPYVENWQSIIVLAGQEPIASPKELDGKKVGYQKATTSTEYLKKLRDTGEVECEVFEYEKVMDCYNDLDVGRIDVILCDSVVSDTYVADNPGKYDLTWVQSSVEGDEPELFGIAVKKGNTGLLEDINAALAELKANGKYKELCETWGLVSSMVS